MYFERYICHAFFSLLLTAFNSPSHNIMLNISIKIPNVYAIRVQQNDSIWELLRRKTRESEYPVVSTYLRFWPRTNTMRRPTWTRKPNGRRGGAPERGHVLRSWILNIRWHIRGHVMNKIHYHPKNRGANKKNHFLTVQYYCNNVNRKK